MKDKNSVFAIVAFGLPNFFPVEYRVPIAVTSWLAGIVGFSIKEALGGQAPKQYLKRQLFNGRLVKKR